MKLTFTQLRGTIRPGDLVTWNVPRSRWAIWWDRIRLRRWDVPKTKEKQAVVDMMDADVVDLSEIPEADEAWFKDAKLHVPPKRRPF